MSFGCHSHTICMRSYFIYLYSYAIRMSVVCNRIPSACHLYVLVCHPYVTRVYSYVICMSPVLLICHPHLTRMYSYVIRISLVCTRMFFFLSGFSSQTLTIHSSVGEGRGPSFIPLYHFHLLTNIETFICNFA